MTLNEETQMVEAETEEREWLDAAIMQLSQALATLNRSTEPGGPLGEQIAEIECDMCDLCDKLENLPRC